MVLNNHNSSEYENSDASHRPSHGGGSSAQRDSHGHLHIVDKSLYKLSSNRHTERKSALDEIDSAIKSDHESTNSDIYSADGSSLPVNPGATADIYPFTDSSGGVELYFAKGQKLPLGPIREEDLGIQRTRTTNSGIQLIRVTQRSLEILGAADERTIENGTHVVIGRQPGPSGMLVERGYISRLHAIFGVDLRGRCYIRDLGSVNGTYLNKERIPDHINIFVSPRDTVTLAGYWIPLKIGTHVSETHEVGQPGALKIEAFFRKQAEEIVGDFGLPFGGKSPSSLGL
jgi:hypothetical protein